VVGPADVDSAGAWVNLVQTHRVIQAAVEERLEAATGLSWSELEALMRLSISPGRRLKMIDIADQLLASKSGITRLVDRLEANGLISREVPPDNRRVIYGRITEAGLEALQKGRGIFMTGLEDAFSRHLSDPEVRQLRHILRKLLEGNGAWEDHRCLPAFDRQAAETERADRPLTPDTTHADTPKRRTS
jgi:DNA-binding MarR family transcriptional regulator